MVLNILFTSLKKKTNSLFTILDQVPDLLVLKLSAPTTHALLLKKEEESQGREIKNASEVCTEVGTTKEKESFRASRSSITWNCLPVLFFWILYVFSKHASYLFHQIVNAYYHVECGYRQATKSTYYQ
jgi:hypothetical protein